MIYIDPYSPYVGGIDPDMLGLSLNISWRIVVLCSFYALSLTVMASDSPLPLRSGF